MIQLNGQEITIEYYDDGSIVQVLGDPEDHFFGYPCNTGVYVGKWYDELESGEMAYSLYLGKSGKGIMKEIPEHILQMYSDIYVLNTPMTRNSIWWADREYF